MQSNKRGLAEIALVLLLITVASLSAFAQEETVEIRARVSGQILLSVIGGATIDFDVDPISNPEDYAQTDLEVMTNAEEYAITGEFSDFKIGGYDLIENEKFFIQSIAPGTGTAISGWTLLQKRMTILKGEDGMTEGETTVVEYLLQVDFSVPAGEAELSVVYTAVASF